MGSHGFIEQPSYIYCLYNNLEYDFKKLNQLLANLKHFYLRVSYISYTLPLSMSFTNQVLEICFFEVTFAKRRFENISKMLLWLQENDKYRKIPFVEKMFNTLPQILLWRVLIFSADWDQMVNTPATYLFTSGNNIIVSTKRLNPKVSKKN